MLKKFLLALILAIIVCMLPAARKALVIGNAAYEGKPLRNTINDAQDVTEALKNLGFVVNFKTNLSRSDMTRTIIQFTDNLDSVDEAVFYFAGHGVQIDGSNYLVPVYPPILDEISAESDSYNCSQLLVRMKRPKVAILFFDACRNNPFTWTRKLSRGLANMDVMLPNQCIVFSSESGKEAMDGLESDRNSPFTAAVLKYISQPLDFTDFFRNIRTEVVAKTDNFQRPYKSGELEYDYYFNPPPLQTEQSTPIVEQKTLIITPEPVIKPIPEPEMPKLVLDMGSVEVSSNLDGEVFIDDADQPYIKIAHNAPVLIPKMRPGSAIITVQTASETQSKTVDIAANETSPIQFSFAEPKKTLGFIKLSEAAYLMGSNRGDEKPAHTVSLSPFVISVSEVSVSEFRQFVQASSYISTAESKSGADIFDTETKKWRTVKGCYWNKPGYEIGDSHPVSCVSWYDAIAYCNWRSSAEGLIPCYSIKGISSSQDWSKGSVACDFSANGYRLPTEAEWEFAARGNNPINSFSGSNELTDVATCVMNSDLKAGEVAIHKPNEFGIYDMSGNVNEWCWDWYDVGYYSRSPFQDPTGPTRGSFRVLRGGAWFDDNQPCGVSIRSNANPGSCEAGIGFRVVKTAR